MDNTPLLRPAGNYGSTDQPISRVKSIDTVLSSIDFVDKITSFLSPKDTRALFVKILPEQNHPLSGSEENHFSKLQKYWNSHSLYKIYNRHLQQPNELGPKQWFIALRKLLLREVGLLTKTIKMTDNPNLSPLHLINSLYQKLLPELQQIPWLVNQHYWEPGLQIPMRGGWMQRPKDLCNSIMGYTCFSSALLAIFGCTQCCCGVHVASMVCASVSAGALLGPCCVTATFCVDYQSLDREDPFRFQRIQEIYREKIGFLGGLYEEYWSLLPNALYSNFKERKERREACYDRIEAIVETCQILGPTFLPGLKDLKEKLPQILEINSLEMTERDLWYLNRTRLILRGFNTNTSVDTPPSAATQIALRNAFAQNGDLEVASIMLREKVDVLLLAQQISNNPGLSLNFASLFVRCGGDLSMISPLSARWLWHLLREGIFAKDRKLLDHICSKGGTRYDLAFVFFLFGFDSSEIERLLKYNQLVRYEQLQQIREAARGSQTLSKQPISLPTECLRSASLQTLRGDGRFQVLEQANATLRRRLAAEAEAARRAAEDRPRRMPGP